MPTTKIPVHAYGANSLLYLPLEPLIDALTDAGFVVVPPERVRTAEHVIRYGDGDVHHFSEDYLVDRAHRFAADYLARFFKEQGAITSRQEKMPDGVLVVNSRATIILPEKT